MKHPKHYDTDESTSKRMASVKLKKGREETALAKVLWHKGIRYWLNYKKLPGSPDIAIKRYNIAIFVDGEFWHGKDWDSRKSKLIRNKDYWVEKIEENISRDERVDMELTQLGWIPVHFWSKRVKQDANGCAEEIIELIEDIDRRNAIFED